METTVNNDDTVAVEEPGVYTVNSKRTVLIGFALWQVASAIATTLVAGSEVAERSVLLFTIVGNAVAVLIWSHIDARERGIPLGPGFRIFVILLGPIALLYYLFKSRGVAGGFRSIGWLLLYLLP